MRSDGTMKFTEQEVVIQSAYPLAGTLTIPSNDKAKHPIVIMVHGSGDVDRNENSKHLKMNAFKELSDLIADLGFVTLRYDKRGIGDSGGDFYETGFFDLIDDAVAAVQYAKDHPQIDDGQIILLGHSEGCLVAPAVNKQVEVQGMILLAGTAEPLADTTAWQREQIKEDINSKTGFEGFLVRLLKVANKLDKTNDKLTKKMMATDKPVIRYLGRKMNAKWNREHLQFDVRDYLAEVTCPVIAITGTKDVQVRPSDTEKICELVQGECEHYLIQDMTHILRKTAVKPQISNIIKDYKKQVQNPIDSELKDEVTSWLQKHFILVKNS